jgi:hypothetical protein
MQNAAGGGASVQSSSRNDNYNSIVSDLVSLIARVQTSMGLIESAIAREAPLGNREISVNLVVLDDVTPGYLKANAALNSCHAGLGLALHFLMDAEASKHQPNEYAECVGAPVGSTTRA